LVEALVALTVATLASGALFLGLYSSLGATDQSLEQATAQGIAEQVIDEVLGKHYAMPGAGPYQSSLGPSSWESAGSGRSRFNDTDDYHGFAAQPLEDRHGIELGSDDGAGGERHANFKIPSGFFNDWKQEIDVYYVDEANPAVRLSSGQSSNLRAVEVRILHAPAGQPSRELVRLRRVYGYVPAL
jgi:hypothetical protein